MAKKVIKIEYGLEELDSALDGLSRSASLTTCGDVESNPGPGIGR